MASMNSETALGLNPSSAKSAGEHGLPGKITAKGLVVERTFAFAWKVGNVMKQIPDEAAE